MRLAFVPVGGTAKNGRHRCGGNYEISKEVYTCKKGIGLCSSTRTTDIPLTPYSAHYSNGTVIDKRNGQKGMLGTRIIHILCPMWKRLFAAMVRERVSEEHFLPNWHEFFQGRWREGAMLVQRCSHLTTMEKSHLNSITDMSNAFSCTKKETLEERTKVQGRPMDGAEVRKPSGLPSGTRWRVHLHVKRGLLWTSEALENMEVEPPNPPIMMKAAPFRNESGRLMELLRRRLVHRRRAARPHSGLSQRRHPEQRSITRQHVGKGSSQAELL